jgi:hypothetical protein
VAQAWIPILLGTAGAGPVSPRLAWLGAPHVGAGCEPAQEVRCASPSWLRLLPWPARGHGQPLAEISPLLRSIEPMIGPAADRVAEFRRDLRSRESRVRIFRRHFSPCTSDHGSRGSSVQPCGAQERPTDQNAPLRSLAGSSGFRCANLVPNRIAWIPSLALGACWMSSMRGAVHALESALLVSGARMAKRSQHRVSEAQDGCSERTARGHGQPRAATESVCRLTTCTYFRGWNFSCTARSRPASTWV